jgi:DNA mismatch repair protein MutS2
MVEKYANLLGDVKRNKKQIIEKARQEAYEIVADSNKAIENTIKEIKEVKADKSRTKDIRKKLIEKKDSIKNQLGSTKVTESKQDSIENINSPITIGDYVKIKNTDIIGELIDVEGKDAMVDVNDVKLKTTLAKLVKTNQRPNYKSTFRSRRNRQNIMSEINEKAANFSLTVDLRGKRAEEALSILQKYVDEAILLSMHDISILHGKGDGILRPLIRDYLKTIEEIKDFGDAPLDMGGAGITKVHFH